jgi:hypothetical protein
MPHPFRSPLFEYPNIHDPTPPTSLKLFSNVILCSSVGQNRYSIITPPPPWGIVYIHNIKLEYPTPHINNLRVMPRVTSIDFTR